MAQITVDRVQALVDSWSPIKTKRTVSATDASMSGEFVKLTKDYVALVRLVATMQQRDVDGNHRRGHIDESDDDFDTRCDSLGAELAFALHRTLPWWSWIIGQHDLPDVGKRTDVKWTKYDNGHLLIPKDDNPDWIYVLVRGALPKYELVGWRAGKSVMRPEYWTELVPNTSFRLREPWYCVDDYLLSVLQTPRRGW